MKTHTRFVIAGVVILTALISGASPVGAGNAPPANDNLAEALAVAFQPYTDIQSTGSATTELGETLAFNNCQGDFTGATNVGATVWYKYTHSGANVNLQLDTVASEFDTVIAVYTGPAASPTYPGLTQIACGDQEFGSFQAGLTFVAVAGQTYYIQAGGWNGGFGRLALNLSPIVSTAGLRFTVNSTADNGDPSPEGVCDSGGGVCTLREALQESNTAAGTDNIWFSIGSGAVTIAPGSGYGFTAGVVIDARTQPGFSSAPIVALDGIAVGGTAFSTTATPSSIRGLVIQRFASTAVLSVVGGNVVQGNYIGTSLNGLADAGNGHGVYLASVSNNAIGGTTAAARNVISGNSNGVFVDGFASGANNNAVLGNYIGVDAAGTGDLGNDGYGVTILATAGTTGNVVGGSLAGARNVISGNGVDGVSISGATATGNTVAGNFIGTNALGNGAVPNSERGVRIEFGADNNTIGGSTAASRNVISGNTLDGVLILDVGATSNSVQGNYIGTNAAGNATVPNGGAGVAVSNAASNTIGGPTGTPGAAPGNVVSGNVHGIVIYGEGADGNTVQANVVGLNATGDAGLGNSDVGIWVLNGADDNVIGGTAAGAKNVASGNARGIAIFDSGTTGNIVQGNYAGTNLAGTAAIGNASEGVGIGYGASGNTVGGTAAGAGNLLSGNGQNGVRIGEGGAGANVVEGNFIGTNATGTAAVANGTNGVWILGGSSGNTIGSGNVISGNTGNGVLIDASNANTVSGTRIGTDAAGTAAVPNGGDGLRIDNASQNIIGTSVGATPGGACTGGCNLISGNSGHGVRINGGPSNHVRSSFVGLDVTGLADLGNGGDGVRVEAGASNIVGGGTASEGNVISGNAGSGVDIRGASSTGGAVRGSLIGTDSTGNLDRSNDLHGVHLSDNADAWIIGHNTLRNVISGHSTGYGVFVEGTSSGHIILGNNIGTNATGTAALGNGTGVFIDGSSDNQVGLSAFVGNLISGNGRGVWISGAGATGNTLVRNYIGTDAAGSAAVGNSTQGIMIDGAPNNTIGGTVPSERNVISGNGESGVDVRNPNATANSIIGNYIGTNAAGTAAVANYNGVSLLGSATGTFLGSATGITPGGACTGGCNLISGNSNRGVFLQGTGGNTVQGNFIGTNAAGTGGVGNGFFPLDVSAPNNLIGGATPAARNIISANANGVTLVGANNTLIGNYIGVQTDGASPLGNTSFGIWVYGPSPGTVIGGTGANDQNVIAHNAWVGIRLEDLAGTPVNVRIQRNSIFHNAQIGIDLGTDGVTANDTGDGDAGPNNLQNYPVLALSTVGGGTTTVSGSLNSTANTQFTLEFFQSFACDPSGQGEGQLFLGQATVTTDGSGNFNFNPALPGEAGAGSFITATATDPAGSTSEFSACIPAVNDGDDDNDGYTDDAESGAPLCTSAGDDDGDGTANDGCPGGPVQEGPFSEAQFKIGTGSQDPCGIDGWPSNLFDGGASANKLTIQDVTSFVAPDRHFDTNPGDPFYNPRWDIRPGAGALPKFINIQDVLELVAGPTGNPPMFGGGRAFGQTCPFPP